MLKAALDPVTLLLLRSMLKLGCGDLHASEMQICKIFGRKKALLRSYDTRTTDAAGLPCRLQDPPQETIAVRCKQHMHFSPARS